MKLQLDKEGYVIGYALLGEMSNSVDYGDVLPDDFEEEFSHYRLTDGVLEKLSGYISEADRQAIRFRRERECFKIVDRPLWLQALSPAHFLELTAWYKKWLDAPETGIIPACPDWLEGGED